MAQETSQGHREITCRLAIVSLTSSHSKLCVTTLRKKLLYPLITSILLIYFSPKSTWIDFHYSSKLEPLISVLEEQQSTAHQNLCFWAIINMWGPELDKTFINKYNQTLLSVLWLKCVPQITSQLMQKLNTAYSYLDSLSKCTLLFTSSKSCRVFSRDFLLSAAAF